MNTYRHSGAVTLTALLLATLAGVAAAVVLGIAYTWAIVFVPFIYVNFLLTAGLGFAIGFVVARAATFGKTRNNLATAGLGLLFGLVGLYIAWAADMRARVAQDELVEALWAVVKADDRVSPDGAYIGVPFLLLRPDELKAWMAVFYDMGMWGLRAGGDVSGMFLALIWLIEAGIITGLAAVTAYGISARRPFCERCQTWIDTEEGAQRLSLAGDTDATNRLLTGDLSAAGKILRAKPDDAAFLRLDLACCKTCQESNYFTVERVHYVQDKKGNLSTKTETVAKFVTIAHRDVDAVRNAGLEPPANEQAEQVSEAT